MSALSTLPSFLAYLAVAAAVLSLFLAAYLRFTPYPEIALIREGNAAAAVSVSGAMIGFALPIANVIRNSGDLVDVAVWSAIACAVQLAIYLVTRRLLPHLGEQISGGKAAPAIFLAALSITAGLLNAACMEP